MDFKILNCEFPGMYFEKIGSAKVGLIKSAIEVF